MSLVPRETPAKRPTGPSDRASSSARSTINSGPASKIRTAGSRETELVIIEVAGGGYVFHEHANSCDCHRHRAPTSPVRASSELRDRRGHAPCVGGRPSGAAYRPTAYREHPTGHRAGPEGPTFRGSL